MRFAYALLIVFALLYLVVSAALLLWIYQAGAFSAWREVALASRGAAPGPFALLRAAWVYIDLATAVSAVLGAFAALGCACAVWIGRRRRHAPADPVAATRDPLRALFEAWGLAVPISSHSAGAIQRNNADGGCATPLGAAAVRNAVGSESHA